MAKKFFSIDARALIALGRNSIKDHTTALLELVKNSYDADAENIDIDIFSNSEGNSNYIRIADNGIGMTDTEVEHQWLRIGFSEKRKNPSSEKKRRKTGEKGIGRLSADRLGAVLELNTKANGKNAFGLRVNWNDFERDGADLSTIPVNTIDNVNLVVPKRGDMPSPSGTELIIKNLRQIWDEEDVKNLYEEISILTPPFEGFENDFKITINTDVSDKYSGEVHSSFSGSAEVELEVDFDDKGNPNYKIYERKLDNSQTPPVVERIQADHGEMLREQFIQIDKSETDGSETEDPNDQQQDLADSKKIPSYPTIGSFKVILKFFPRKSSVLEGTNFSMQDLREFLDINSGVKIYRDKIRVKPYGNPNDPEGDWLGLSDRKTRNPAGAGRKSFRVGPNQIVGGVFLTAEANPKLIDSSSREGLIHDDEYNELKRLLNGCIILLESHYHTKFTTEKKQNPQNVIQKVRTLDYELKNLATGLSRIKEEIPPSSNRNFTRQLERIDNVIATIKTASKSIEELASQATIFRGLATLGIAATVFGHETQSSISGTTSAIHTARRLLKKSPPAINSALEEIDKSSDFAEKVARWGSFALDRVVRDKRKKQKTNISNVVRSIHKELLPAFQASNIQIQLIAEEVEGNVIIMDVESVLINLLTNAYTACQQLRKDRSIRLEVRPQLRSKPGALFIVEDSGPGIPEKYLEKVWEPLFSTKMDNKGRQIGTGLGLMIVKSTIDELGGIVSLEKSEKLGGASFSIWIPV